MLIGRVCFNSLQTGKHIQRMNGKRYDLGQVGFQFPSNGKAISKGRQKMECWCACYLFQFPSNGKAYPKERGAETEQVIKEVFQFPSNGKAYPKTSKSFPCGFLDLRVSIPFKRESISKEVGKTVRLTATGTGFNSLQTGKHIQSQIKVRGSGHNSQVSIPFKREKHIQSVVDWIVFSPGTLLFQFPSNGKAYPKVSTLERSCKENGCFNSLQTGKHIQSYFQTEAERSCIQSFNSLQTGKHIQSKEGEAIIICVEMFQFPSNGKAYPKETEEFAIPSNEIWFQFPSNGKAYPKLIAKIRPAQLWLFQFPSNGKAYPKSGNIIN